MELKEYLDTHDKKILHLGCSSRCPEGHFGIDIEDLPGVDLVWDLTKGIPADDNVFDEIIAKDVLEHIPQGKLCIQLMEDIYRTLVPGGVVHIEVPSTDGGGIGAFGHPYHVSWWSKTTLKYYLDDAYTNGWRSTIGVKCFFKPEMLVTFFNEYDMAYVKATLSKLKD